VILLVCDLECSRLHLVVIVMICPIAILSVHLGCPLRLSYGRGILVSINLAAVRVVVLLLRLDHGLAARSCVGQRLRLAIGTVVLGRLRLGLRVSVRGSTIMACTSRASVKAGIRVSRTATTSSSHAESGHSRRGTRARTESSRDLHWVCGRTLVHDRRVIAVRGSIICVPLSV